MKIAQEAIASLHEQTAERALIIQSTRTELQRKLDEVNAKSEFIKEHLTYSSPLSTIRALTVHDKVINELKPDNDLPRPLAVEGDLALAGILEVKPKQETIMPVGVRNRDVYFDERNVRNVDYPSTTFDGLSSSTFDTTNSSQVDSQIANQRGAKVRNLKIPEKSYSESSTFSTSESGTTAYNNFKAEVSP